MEYCFILFYFILFYVVICGGELDGMEDFVEIYGGGLDEVKDLVFYCYVEVN